jgi:hypothetical protein
MYVDAFSLVSVDHDPAVQVFMNPHGTPHSVRNPVTPECKTKDGSNCT